VPIRDHRISVLAVAATVRLLTNNPGKVAARERYGIRVAERVPPVFPANGPNELCPRAKTTKIENRPSELAKDALIPT
jgi:GTP cyclohydrolase II